MLVEFSVENYRSFREKQTFSMVASSAYGKLDERNVAHTGFTAVPYVLRLACIYGANGAGKSSLIRAMGIMSRFVRDSFHNRVGGELMAVPFIFHDEWRDRPSTFEVIFIHNENLYQYGFSLTRKRVEEEWLIARPKNTGRERVYFTREFDSDAEIYKWKINPKYLKFSREVLKSATRTDALFLSTAVHLNVGVLVEAYEWITGLFDVSPTPWESPRDGTNTSFQIEQYELKGAVIDFMKRGEVRLNDIIVDEVPLSGTSFFKRLPKEVKETVLRGGGDPQDLEIQFVRKDNKSSPISLSLIEESTGTQNLYNIAGTILDGIENKRTIVLDEMISEIHTMAVHNIIDMLYESEINKSSAQLILSTHDTSVTNHDEINRDQIWMVEKTQDLASRLIPLSDFKPRGGRSFQESYLQGRLGAVPRYWRYE